MAGIVGTGLFALKTAPAAGSVASFAISPPVAFAGVIGLSLIGFAAGYFSRDHSHQPSLAGREIEQIQSSGKSADLQPSMGGSLTKGSTDFQGEVQGVKRKDGDPDVQERSTTPDIGGDESFTGGGELSPQR